ncbi:MAG: GspE/PulE family protein [Patescibacteria group bacterium]|nr:GspE/PulE family protein [Patescibacteria group bacterium]
MATMGSIEELLGKKKPTTAPKAAGEKSVQQKFDDKMRQIKLKEKEDETKKAAASMGLDYVNLVGFPIAPEALQMIPRAQAREHKVICFLQSGDEVRLAAVDPKDPAIEEIAYQVQERTHGNLKTYLVSEYSFETAEKIYDALPEVKVIVKGVQITAEDLERFQREVKTIKELNEHVQKVSITDFVALIVASSLRASASDIHIEAEEEEVKVRYRIDGVLHQVASVKKELWPRIVNRFKLFSGLKLNITSLPQDGRFTIFLSNGEKVEVRVSTLPTAYGESIVMRLLKSSSIGLKFDDLGVRGRAWEQLKREVERPNGMIITTGPTGSGKTTTLYAVLSKLNDEETKIITLEDPVEYKLAGISQSQIDKSKDYTFAKGLNSILRQDPDVVMVGEIRDLETAEVAIQAALTGHLMISTIHTNSAAGAIPRFLSMGVKPFLLAPALNAVIGQRLVRRICPDCKAPDELDADTMKRVRETLAAISLASGVKVDLDKLKFWKGKGCETCAGIGLKGRMGIYEIFAMSPTIEKVILSGNVSEYQMQEIAVNEGMVTMAQDGLLKALDGITTVEEVFSVAE